MAEEDLLGLKEDPPAPPTPDPLESLLAAPEQLLQQTEELAVAQLVAASEANERLLEQLGLTDQTPTLPVSPPAAAGPLEQHQQPETVDELDAAWNELMAEAPPTLAHVPFDALAPVVESDDEEEEEQPPLAAPSTTDQATKLLTYTTEAPAEQPAPAATPFVIAEEESAPAANSDAPAVTTPHVPDMVARLEQQLPAPVAAAPEPIETPVISVRPRRRGGPPPAVLMERMAVGESVPIVS